MSFFGKIVYRRLQHFFQKENTQAFAYPEIKLEQDNSPLNHFLVKHNLNIEEYIVLLLELTPHAYPIFLTLSSSNTYLMGVIFLRPDV